MAIQWQYRSTVVKLGFYPEQFLQLSFRDGFIAFANSSEAQGQTLQEVLLADNPFQEVLTEYEKSNLKDYQEIFGEDLTYNLNQSAKKFPVISKPQDGVGGESHTMYALIHNSGISWCGKAGRWLVPQELALLQGLDAVCQDGVRTTCLAVPRKRGRSACAGQIGNSMCTAIVGSFLYRVSKCMSEKHVSVPAKMGKVRFQ